MMINDPPFSPLVRCLPIEAPQPSLEDNRADADRLKQSLARELSKQGVKGGEPRIPYPVLTEVALRFRTAGFRGGAVVNMLDPCLEIVDFLPAVPDRLPALALDLGTTHLEAALLDLQSGDTLAAGQIENRQIEFGADILTRIHFAGPPDIDVKRDGREQGLARLQESVIASINELAGRLAGMAGILTGDIRALSVSGNTAMVHFFLGATPFHICREPYIPLVNSPDPCHAHELRLCIAPMAPVWIMPGIGSYFGGDLVSGILATGLDTAAETVMLIDVGTNAEVVLGNRDWLIACAGAAGPALEGGVARMGVKAGPGAVEHVAIDRDRWRLSYRTIDGAPAVGICGSGMIDLAAELYLSRVMDFRGKFRPVAKPESQDHEQFLQRHLVADDSGYAFIVVPGAEAADGVPVVLSQADMDALIRSKAAMYAILTTLVAQVGVEFAELNRVYVAGAFGGHIDPGRAITLGMIPDLPPATYEPAGNSSLRGAGLVLLSGDCRERSREIRRKITYLELNVNQEFMLRFSGARFIPHADPALFPSVPVLQAEGQ
ncbi:MAG: ASKHA domain-containing protein [Desulfobulbaceae bacterium]|nr:ASKHA domain-containing protein [Desulfobulbaceae bacterium]